MSPSRKPATPSSVVLPFSDDSAGEASFAARALKLIVMAIAIAGLYFGQALFVPFALAALMSFVLDPAAGFLQRVGFPRSMAVVLVIVLASVALIGSAAFAARQVIDLGADVPAYQQTIERKVRGLRQSVARHAVLGQASRVLDAIEDELGAAGSVLSSPAPARQRAPMRVELAEPGASPLQALAQLFGPLVGPLTSFGLVLVFVVFILLERNDLRDRFLRVMGGELSRTTEALNDAAQRVSRYLTMQLLINLGYGLAMAAGLWGIGVPGALLWGGLAAVLRFIPYLGPIIASALPLLLAFAVDPGWQMLLWTLGLLAALELLINNVIEPWAYGSSTGVAPVSIVISAAFWTLLWGPIGLILATPLTVCLVVMGRHLPHLGFLDVMLGDTPVFDAPTRLYQRLIAGNVEEAIELAHEEVRQGSSLEFLSRTALPALRMGAAYGSGANGARHRHRLLTGLRQLIRDLADERGGKPPAGAPCILCIGARGESDAVLAALLQEALNANGVQAGLLPPSALAAEQLDSLPLSSVALLVMCTLNADPRMHLRYLGRQLRRRSSGLQLLALCPALPPDAVQSLAGEAGMDRIEVDLAETSLLAARLLRDQHPPAGQAPGGSGPAGFGTSGQDSLQLTLSETARRVADVFDMSAVVVSLVDAHGIAWLDEADGLRCQVWPDRVLPVFFEAAGQSCCVRDVSLQPEFADSEGLRANGLRFCAGTPLRDHAGNVAGSLCVLDGACRQWSEADAELLEELGAELMAGLEKLSQDAQQRSRALMALCAPAQACPAAQVAGAAAPL